MELGVENRRHVQFSSMWLTRASRLKNVRLHRGRRNTIERAKDNIHAHYDLGNEFFRLFLDETMTYSSAYFSSPDQPLADAQRNKYRMLCEQRGHHEGRPRAGDRLRLGRVRDVRGGAIRVPRDLDHDLGGAVRAGAGAGRRGAG